MRLVIFLLALAGCSICAANDNKITCLVGNLVVRHNVIISKSVENKLCYGLCRKQTFYREQGSIVLLSCEEQEISNSINDCSTNKIETSCICHGDKCNNVELEEKLTKPSEFVASNITCFVGFSNNNTVTLGQTVICQPGDVCTSVVLGGDSSIVNACLPQATCDNMFQDPTFQSGTKCLAFYTDQQIQMCCCYDNDCRSLAPISNPPPPSPWIGKNVLCYQGIAVNRELLNGGSFSQCAGECGSARTISKMNGDMLWIEVFFCDPAAIFDNLDISNECKDISNNNDDGELTSMNTICACNTDKCLDPTVVPPVWPGRHH
ncbi:unnamed protein product [Caenorhabditis angaria]|uniref:ET module n=1 Tax=Caenorhabditis angaria TaxID=860376 RepID=A0A9P1IZT7_9PELO|nr:unnamed protein product [Caenorhabditis angaria]